MRRSTLFLATAAAAALAACSAGESTNSGNAAANDMATSNELAAMPSDPSNPYGAAEMQMHERMTAAVGANAADTWVRMMIEHHRGGIAMSDILLAQGGDPRFLEKARMGAEQQRRDIAELERMQAGGATGQGPANPYAEVGSRMHDRMVAARGANPAETWARKMIAHHQGAIDMSEIVIRQGGNPAVSAMARRTADMQRREIRELEALLSGGGTVAAAPEPEPSGERPARAGREPGGDPKATPARRPTAPDRAAPPPAPPAAPPTTCTPEHRAAGHC